MKIKVIGKQGCAPCKATKNKVQNILNKNDWNDKIEFEFVDVETEEGEVQKDFYEIDNIPCLVIENDEEDIVHQSEEIDNIPKSDEIKSIIKEMLGD